MNVEKLDTLLDLGDVLLFALLLLIIYLLGRRHDRRSSYKASARTGTD